MDAYSMDLRERVAAECDAGTLSQPDIAEAFNVSVSFITRLLRRRRETGSLAAKPHTGGPAPILTERDRERIADRVRAQPDMSLAELCRWLSHRVSDSTMSRLLISLGLTRKKRRSMPTSGTVPGWSNSAAGTGRKPRAWPRNASFSSMKAEPRRP
jgi:transposase